MKVGDMKWAQAKPDPDHATRRRVLRGRKYKLRFGYIVIPPIGDRCHV